MDQLTIELLGLTASVKDLAVLVDKEGDPMQDQEGQYPVCTIRRVDFFLGFGLNTPYILLCTVRDLEPGSLELRSGNIVLDGGEFAHPVVCAREIGVGKEVRRQAPSCVLWERRM